MDRNAPALEVPDLHARIPLLDHGYLQLVESWGSDQRIVESARQSTDKGFLGWGPNPCECLGPDDQYPRADPNCKKCGGLGSTAGDEKLLAFLWKHKHSTPFEFGGLTIEVQAPIFVFREWHRHRVPFGYSELSARYAPMPNLNYIPTLERCMAGGGHLNKNKQAGTVDGAEVLTEEAAISWCEELHQFYADAEAMYQHGLSIGMPKELARICVPVGRYSRMRATGNLRGWLAFLALRYAGTAQFEIRVFAEQVAKLIGQTFPRTAQVAEVVNAFGEAHPR